MYKVISLNKLIKKRIIYIFSVVFFSLLIYVAANNLKEMREQTLIDANATPITNKTIIIDAGHGLPDQGATRFL